MGWLKSKIWIWVYAQAIGFSLPDHLRCPEEFWWWIKSRPVTQGCLNHIVKPLNSLHNLNRWLMAWCNWGCMDQVILIRPPSWSSSCTIDALVRPSPSGVIMEYTPHEILTALLRATLNAEIPSAAQISIGVEGWDWSVFRLVMKFGIIKFWLFELNLEGQGQSRATTIPEGQNWPRVKML